MISISDLHKVYDQSGQTVKALNGINLQVQRGEIYGVVGSSGAGKSTLIRCVNRLERPTSGSIRVNGQEITTLSSAELNKARQNIGMIFQQFNLLSSRTVAGNVAFPLELAGFDKAKRNARVDELLDLVGLSDKAAAYPAQLSGGQKQRVGIARALATEPQVLLSDEATSALDPQTTTSILNLLKDLNRRLGLTILLITHEMDVVKQICDRVASLQDGRIIEEGTLNDLILNSNSQLSQAFFPAGEVVKSKPGVISASITFIGAAAGEPVLASLVRKFDVDVNIMGGSIQDFGEKRIGRLRVELTGDQVPQALDYLHGLGLQVEVH